MRRLREALYALVAVVVMVGYLYLVATGLGPRLVCATWTVAGRNVVAAAVLLCLLASLVGPLGAAWLAVRRRSWPLAALTSVGFLAVVGYFISFAPGRSSTGRAALRAEIEAVTDGRGGGLFLSAIYVALVGTLVMVAVVAQVRRQLERRGQTLQQRGLAATWIGGWVVIAAATAALAAR